MLTTPIWFFNLCRFLSVLVAALLVSGHKTYGHIVQAKKSGTIELLMPEVQPRRESYYCAAWPTNRYDHEYIVEFEPNATKSTAHHILIYGCTVPGYYERDTPHAVWNCGEMSGSSVNFNKGPVCSSGFNIIYAWAMDAPKLTLPDGVGFKIGKDTEIHYLVLQVHYGDHDFHEGMRDRSGIILKTLPSNTTQVSKRAGVLLLGTGGVIPEKSTTRMESACIISGDINIHPFGFRTHTHKLGVAVSGWRVRNGVWTLIGKHDPQQPQMFYPVEDRTLVVSPGDTVAARCTMVNGRDRAVYVGSTGNDEMCNFYIMYYVDKNTDGDRLLTHGQCFTDGPPDWNWENIMRVPPKIDKLASQL